ncbi:hypothetical protein ALC60_05866 [Trachymyrmex zeteki]|uniref:Uncharacterized protein n=1 Tax=Mycetomoellerius zeteki TaxID=64791 RepID=A0A151X4E7_9HYME|nr:hypothetical protein ALC60_05866 [Trachymyrmex zeteki]
MPLLRVPKNNGYFNKNLIMLVAYFSPIGIRLIIYGCVDCIEAIALRDTRATTVRRKCFDKIYFTSQKNITCEFIALGRQLLWCRWPGNV